MTHPQWRSGDLPAALVRYMSHIKHQTTHPVNVPYQHPINTPSSALLIHLINTLPPQSLVSVATGSGAGPPASPIRNPADVRTDPALARSCDGGAAGDTPPLPVILSNTSPYDVLPNPIISSLFVALTLTTIITLLSRLASPLTSPLRSWTSLASALQQQQQQQQCHHHHQPQQQQRRHQLTLTRGMVVVAAAVTAD